MMTIKLLRMHLVRLILSSLECGGLYCASVAVTIPDSLYTPDWQGSGDVWEAYRRTCEPGAPARRQFSSLRAPFVNPGPNPLPGVLRPGDEFDFVTSLHGNYSFCNNPWARYTQGHFFSDWRTIPIMFPIFSPAKAPGYSDIRMPSHYYYGTSRRHTYGWDEVNLQLKEIDRMETPWERKSDKIFWRGATTGGGSSPPGFSPQYHRQRSCSFPLTLSDVFDKNLI
jgi:Glycosyl transferase family 90